MPPEKHQRKSRSCDICRERKTRCDASGDVEEGVAVTPCAACQKLDVSCTFFYRPRNKGPFNAMAEGPRAKTALELKTRRPQLAEIAEQSPVPHDDAPDPCIEIDILPMDDPPPAATVSYATFDSSHFSETPAAGSSIFDSLMSRRLLMQLIDAHWRLVWPLYPILHRSSVMHDLASGKEDVDSEWAHMILAMISSTIMWLPVPFLPMSGPEAKSLVEAIGLQVKSYLAAPYEYEEVGLTRFLLLYFSTYPRISVSYTRELQARCYGFALAKGYHDQHYLDALSPIDRTVAKRAWWSLYGGVINGCCVRDRPVPFNDRECGDLDLADPICDVQEGLDQAWSEQATIALTGASYLSRVYKLAVDFIERRHRDRRKPPIGSDLSRRLVELEALQLDLARLVTECPAQLMLDLADHESAGEIDKSWGLLNWTSQSSLTGDPGGPGQDMDAVNALRANIYPSIYVLRYYGLQYQEELIALGRAQHFDSGLIRLDDLSEWTDGERSVILAELLMLLRKVPLVALATNSLAAVNKVRYVIVGLLDDLASPASVDDLLNPSHGDLPYGMNSKQARAQRYLGAFTQILAQIEGLYDLDR